MIHDNAQVGAPQTLYKDTQANIEAIGSPAAGMIAFATDTPRQMVYTGSAWKLGLLSDFDNDGLYWDSANKRLGLGDSTPDYKLDVEDTTTATTGGTNYTASVFLAANPSGSANANYIGLLGFANFNSSSYENLGAVIGFRGTGYAQNKRSNVVCGFDGIAEYAGNETAALTTSLYGARYQAKNSGSGRITHGIGFKVLTPVNSGTVDIMYGGYIANITGGTANSALHIEGSGSGNSITFSGANSASLNSKIYSVSANKLNIEASSGLYLNESGGNVGIGTSSPSEKLDVAGAICITDGISAPGSSTGKAKIYVDSADGDLKVKFSDGTTKTLATDS